MVDPERLGLFAAVAACGLAFAVEPAAATGTVACRGADDARVEARITVGRVPVLAVINARFEAGGRIYATSLAGDPAATAIVWGQGVFDEDRLRVDFTDTDINEVLLSLRVERGFEGKLAAEAGVLRIPGQGVWAVVCESG